MLEPAVPVPLEEARRLSVGASHTSEFRPELGTDLGRRSYLRVDDTRDLISIYLLRYDRPNTRRAYARDLATFFESETVTLSMARSVHFVHVNEYVARLQADGCQLSTIRRRVVSLRGFFAWLIALGELELNPADSKLIRRIPRQNAGDHTITVLSSADSERLLSSVELDSFTGVRDHALILVLLYCVLRRSEASAMDVEHIQRMGPYGVLHLPLAKGGANQSVKIPDHVYDVIQGMLTHYGIRSGAIWRSMSRNRSGGRRLSGSSIYSIVNKHARRAGILQTVGAHTLRHTGCTLAIEGGASLQQVQTHARHKSVATTMLYVHQRDRLANSAADFIQIGKPPETGE